MAPLRLLGPFALLSLVVSASCAPVDGPPTDDATGGNTTDGGAGTGGTGGSATGGSATGGDAALGGSGGSASDPHRVGSCTFEDEALAQDVREQVPYGDEDNVLVMQSLSTGEDVSSLEGIACLTALTDLSLFGAQTASVLDLAPVADLSSLSVLGLFGGQYESLDVIPKLSLGYLRLSDLGWTSLDVLEGADVEVLLIEQMPATDLSALASFASLRSVTIDATFSTDLSPLARVDALEDLTLISVPAEDLPALGQLDHLQWVSLTSTHIASLEGLAGAPELVTLDIDVAPDLESLAGLEGLPALYRLTIRESALSDLSALAGSPSLTALELFDGEIADISALGSCPSLEYVTLSGHQIVDLAPLEPLAAVRFLWLERNQIVDLAPLAAASLETLNISDNPLGSLDPLGTLEGLATLYMRGVGATSLDSLAGLELSKLDARENQIEDVSVLVGMPLRELDLTANSISALPDDFVGGTGDCSYTHLEGNPLDAAAKDQLEGLCAGTEQDSYAWDGGSCDNCFILK